MPRKKIDRPSVLPCKTCGKDTPIYRGKLNCASCCHKRVVASNAGKVRSCRTCGQSSTVVPMQPERNQCRECYRKVRREQNRHRRHGYPPCGACEERPRLPDNDGMCAVCSAVADEIDRIAEEAV